MSAQFIFVPSNGNDMGECVLSDVYFDFKAICYRIVLQPSLLDLKFYF